MVNVELRYNVEFIPVNCSKSNIVIHVSSHTQHIIVR